MKVLTLQDRLWFGKHKGKTIRKIIDKDHTYLNWCLEEKIFTLDDRATRQLNRKTDRFIADAVAEEKE